MPRPFAHPHHNLPCDEQDPIVALFRQLLAQGQIIVENVQSLTKAVSDLTAALAPLPAAVDGLEAAVTAAKNNGGLSATDQQALDDAVAQIRTLTTNAQTVVADATDGVDEGAAPGSAGDVGTVGTV